MKVTVSTATGRALDYMVAKANKEILEYDGISYWIGARILGPCADARGCSRYSPSTYGNDAIHIIDREKICLWSLGGDYEASYNGSKITATGETALVAAMRCFVLKCLGEEVDVPNILCSPQRRL